MVPGQITDCPSRLGAEPDNEKEARMQALTTKLADRDWRRIVLLIAVAAVCCLLRI